MPVAAPYYALRVLVLLPPSEAKARDGVRRGAPVDLRSLSGRELTAAREHVLGRLIETSGSPDALRRLGVGATLAGEVENNTRLRQAPARRVSDLYTGVLYAALGLPDLPSAARVRAARQLLVVSALWGALRVHDRVPAYRLSMGADLAGLGPLAAFWRPRLGPVLARAAGQGIVVDCLSGAYRAAWRPSPELAERTLAVRVVREQGGQQRAVSHLAKLTRGQVVRHLLLRPGSPPRSPAAAEAAVREAFECQLVRGRGSWRLDVSVRETSSH